MRSRLAVGLAAAVTLVAMGTAGHAAAPTLDGKKTKKIEFKGSAGMKTNDTWFFTGAPDTYKCKAPADCIRQEFKYKPAKGISGDVLVKMAFTGTGTDHDLYVYDSAGKQIGACGNAYGTGEFVGLKGTDLKSGQTYTVVVNFYRSLPSSNITGSIEFPAKIPARGPNGAFAPVEDEVYGGHLVTCG